MTIKELTNIAWDYRKNPREAFLKDFLKEVERMTFFNFMEVEYYPISE